MKNNRPVGLRKGAWSKEEDELLKKCINTYGEGKWHLIPLRAGLNRCRKSCRLRWLDYLRPNIKKGSFGKDEVDLIKRLHKLLGNRWSLIAGRLPGRTANSVKNFWNTHFEKKIPSTEEETKDKLAMKTITKTNIVRPRPFKLLSKSNVPMSTEIMSSDTNNERNVMKNDDDENTINTHPVFRDECIEWWSNLLYATSEMKDQKLGTSNLIQENVDGKLHQDAGITIGLYDGENLIPIDHDQDASMDVDLWKLLSADDQ